MHTAQGQNMPIIAQYTAAPCKMCSMDEALHTFHKNIS